MTSDNCKKNRKKESSLMLDEFRDEFTVYGTSHEKMFFLIEMLLIALKRA